MSFLKILAQYTFIIQGFAFPLLLLITCYAMYWALTNKARAKLKKENRRHISDGIIDEVEVLKPLSCSNCAGILLVNSDSSKCLHCGCKQSVPIHYSQLFKFREEASKQIQLANTYLKKASYLTSPMNRNLLLLLV